MYNLKLDFLSCDEPLAKELQVISNDEIKMLKSDGLFGNTEIIVAIIAASPIILTQVAGVIKTYIDRDKSKSFTLKINGEEMSFTGNTTKEIDTLLQKYGKQNN